MPLRREKISAASKETKRTFERKNSGDRKTHSEKRRRGSEVCTSRRKTEKQTN